MAKPLDVYRDWLGITETARPLNYYQLLRLATFEDDTAKVRDHYRKMNAHVRKFATGDYAERSQELLNDLAKAMLCLTDAQRKREYDASLGRREVVEGRQRTLEEILLANKVIDQEQLDKARRFADQVGLEVRDAVLQQKMASPDAVMLAYAESQGLPYIDLDDVGVDAQLVPQIPPTTARQHSCVPIMEEGGRVLMASPNPLIPDVEDDLRLRLGMPVRTVLCTPVSLNKAIAKYYPREGVPVAAPGAPAPPGAAEPAAAPPSRKYLSLEEKIKQRTQVSLITFNAVVILYMVYRLLTSEFDLATYGVAFFWALLLGLIAGGIAFGVTWFLQR